MTTVYMTQVEYAEHRGISQPRVSKMVRDGKISSACIKKISGRKLIDRDKADEVLKESLDKIYNTVDKRKQKTNKSNPPDLPPDAPEKISKGGTGGMSLADAQKVQAQYKAALMKLEYEEKSGKLVALEKVDKDWFDTARLTRDAILSIPSRVCAELASNTDVHTVDKRLTEEIVKALESVKI